MNNIFLAIRGIKGFDSDLQIKAFYHLTDDEFKCIKNKKTEDKDYSIGLLKIINGLNGEISSLLKLKNMVFSHGDKHNRLSDMIKKITQKT